MGADDCIICYDKKCGCKYKGIMMNYQEKVDNPEYISDHGFILPKPRSWYKARNIKPQSENGVLFSVVKLLIEIDLAIDNHEEPPHNIINKIKELNRRIKSLWETNPDFKYRTLPYDNNPRFSLDNAMAVATFSRMCIEFNIDAEVAKMNLEKVQINRYWIRFYDVIPYLALLKYTWLKFTIFPVAMVYFFTIIPCLFNKWGDASGRQLGYVKGFLLEDLLEITTWVMKLRGITFPVVYGWYYWIESEKGNIPDDNNPINLLAKKRWPSGS